MCRESWKCPAAPHPLPDAEGQHGKYVKIVYSTHCNLYVGSLKTFVHRRMCLYLEGGGVVGVASSVTCLHQPRHVSDV